jgi:hypothetical protein
LALGALFKLVGNLPPALPPNFPFGFDADL